MKQCSLSACLVHGALMTLVGVHVVTCGCAPTAPQAGNSGQEGSGSSSQQAPFSRSPGVNIQAGRSSAWLIRKGIIDKDRGKLGPVEEKWGVDIVLNQLDYDPCLTMYAGGSVDAVCITNMDVLAPAVGRDSVAILPTSTSDGADACLVTDIDNIEQLAGRATYGLEKSVSQYTFERNLEIQGKDPANYPFKNMDPAAASQAMMSGAADVSSIVVWNPFVMQTLRTRDGAKVLFDSTAIPEEIIDMVVVSREALQRPGGAAFAHAVIDAFYQVNDLLADPTEGDGTLKALGEKFSNLELEDMKVVVQQTKFYGSPDRGMELFARADFQTEIMPRVIDFCQSHEIVDQKPKVGFEDDAAQLNFTTQYMQAVNEARK